MRLILLSLFLFAGQAAADDVVPSAGCSGEPAHVGSVVIFVHYIEPYIGEKRAALMVEDPRECPPNAPSWWKACANLKVWKRQLGQPENPTTVLGADGQPVGCEGEPPVCQHVYTGEDNKIGVPHDPTGKEGRSWHLWGEAEGESCGARRE